MYNAIKQSWLVVIVLLLGQLAVRAASLPDKCDVLIAGAGTGGWAAAVQSARMGSSVLLIEETDWIGGQMNAAGVTSMDEGTIIRNLGIYHEFYERAVETYARLGKSVGTCYFNSNSCAVEPRIGQKILYEFINEVNRKGPGHIDIVLRTHVVKVFRDKNLVRAVDVEITRPEGSVTNHVECLILVDATEYGDVLPLAGARYRVGKCTSDNLDPNARMQANTWTVVMKEYPGGIPADLLVTSPPPGYAEVQNFSHIKVIEEKQHKLWFSDLYADKTPWLAVSAYRGMPDSSRQDTPPYPRVTRTSLNIWQNDSSIVVGDCVNPACRRVKEIEMRLVTLQLLYYLQHELKLPWSVADDEGYDSPYNRDQIARIVAEQPSLKSYERVLQLFPPIAYVRESRRMIGLHTVIYDEICRAKSVRKFADAITVNDYSEDLHGAKSPADMELDIESPLNVANEKLPWSLRAGPFQLPFSAFIPESVDGFLAAEKNFSQSRSVSAATRLQPSTMVNGQAVGTIAALAIKYHIQPRAVDPVQVQNAMLEAGVQLVFDPKAVHRGSVNWKADQLARLHGDAIPVKPLPQGDANP